MAEIKENLMYLQVPQKHRSRTHFSFDGYRIPIGLVRSSKA
jgi:hypothetical protein